MNVVSNRNKNTHCMCWSEIGVYEFVSYVCMHVYVWKYVCMYVECYVYQ